jgi:hypothetical protein
MDAQERHDSDGDLQQHAEQEQSGDEDEHEIPTRVPIVRKPTQAQIDKIIIISDDESDTSPDGGASLDRQAIVLTLLSLLHFFFSGFRCGCAWQVEEEKKRIAVLVAQQRAEKEARAHGDNGGGHAAFAPLAPLSPVAPAQQEEEEEAHAAPVFTNTASALLPV